MDPSIHDILSKGYFPRELPPPFQSQDFAKFIANCGTSIPTIFSNHGFVSKFAKHNLPRPGTLRRVLGIPNPVNFYQLTKCVVTNWPTIHTHTNKSRISLTIPTADSPKRAIDRIHSLEELPLKRAMLRNKSRYILQTDISRFYPSLYTHSIPWALHGKNAAKADRSHRLVGNELDTLVRNAQDRQTIGIPIGPDTSLAIAESVLSSVDDTMSGRGFTNGLRYIDDFEFGFQTLAEAEDALSVLQGILNEYELALNPTKTAILKLPCPIAPLAISELRTFRFRNTAKGQHSDLLHYFDKAFVFANQNPQDAILRYAISRLNGVVVQKQNWKFFENLLLQCAITEPGSIAFVLEQLLRYRDIGYDLNLDQIRDALNSIVEQHAPIGHGGDVSWALWGLVVFQKHLREKASNAAAALDDPIVAILLCHANDKGLVPPNTDWTHLASLMTPEDLSGEMWLFSYEANRNGWFGSIGGGDHVLSHGAFSLLKKQNVSFFDRNLSNTIKATKPASLAPASSTSTTSG
jgi:hypothetical protein